MNSIQGAGPGAGPDPGVGPSPASGADALPGGSILVLCTGNICRSPYIERLLAHELAGTGVVVSSAGTEALVGAPIHESSARRLVAAGGTAHGFAARQLTAHMLRDADLVIGATRAHIAAAAHVAPLTLRKGFALLDLGDLLADVPLADVAAAPGATRAAQVAATAASRRMVVTPRSQEEASIADPFQRSESLYDDMVRDVASAAPALVWALRG